MVKRKRIAAAVRADTRQLPVAVGTSGAGRLVSTLLRARAFSRADTLPIAAPPARRPVTREGPAAMEIGRRLEEAFLFLHREFDHREQRLHAHQDALDRRQQALLAGRPRARWVVPLAVAGALAVGYTLYLLTVMQASMATMASDVAAMNGHMDEMRQSTETLAGDVAAMNRSVARMGDSMGQMNHNVGAIARATAPMGQAAQGMSPFMQAFRSFMPF